MKLSPLRAALLGAGLVLGAAGCSTDPKSTLPYRTLVAAFGTDIVLPSAEQVEQLAYAAAFVQIGDNPAGMMLLAEVEGEQRKWISAEPVILVTDGGRVTRLANWPVELAGFRSTQQDPLTQMHQRATADYRYEIDLMPGYRSRLPMTASLEQRGLEPVQVGYETQTLLHVVERLSMPPGELEKGGESWSVENHYWLRPASGQVIRSLQTPAPGIGPIRIEVVKPYGE